MRLVPGRRRAFNTNVVTYNNGQGKRSRTHALAVTGKSLDLGIELVYLPPYPPDLNPMEFGWKDLKQDLGTLLDFGHMAQQTQEQALELFYQRKG